MGISSSKSTTKPVYEGQITGAAGGLTDVYNQNRGNIQNVTDQITGLLPSMVAKYQAGDAGVNASRNWITSTLGADSANNPYLQQMIDMTGNDVANGVNSHLGTRGLTGGSVQQRMLSHELAKSSTGLRYQDYNNQQALKAQAAGMAPGVAAADTLQIQPLLGVADSAADPVRAAVGYTSGLGGLLGQYTQTKTKNAWGPAFAAAMANAASSFASGGAK